MDIIYHDKTEKQIPDNALSMAIPVATKNVIVDSDVVKEIERSNELSRRWNHKREIDTTKPVHVLVGGYAIFSREDLVTEKIVEVKDVAICKVW